MAGMIIPALGAILLEDGRCRFRVWAPFAEVAEVRIAGDAESLHRLHPEEGGYYTAVVDDVPPGTRYRFRLNREREFPDPASRLQPEGVHGSSEVVQPAFDWNDRNWRGFDIADYVFYELHVGTFTAEGTFDAIHEHLARLRDLGVTAIELMPVAQFSGDRNWGYDGAYPFAVQASYGGPRGLQRLVNACHEAGLAVVLDVVYNHLGPEGNYLGEFGPYFTERYQTPWGAALNFDGPYSDAVRAYFIANALWWIEAFHIDALRLDAVHAIRDLSAYPFLRELSDNVRDLAGRLGRRVHLIAESDLNDRRLCLLPEREGYGLDSQWSDDFHHALHALITGERSGYYEDFGSVEALASAIRQGFVYTGQHSVHRERRHGSSSDGLEAFRFVVCSQNHDQVGNRMLGERLGSLVSPDALKVAAASVLLSPFLPLLFMGEEYGETAPFGYFTSHSDPQLIEAVREGRRQEFSSFAWVGELPDPQSDSTFEEARLRHHLREEGRHRRLHDFYRELLRLRLEDPVLRHRDKDDQHALAFERERSLLVRRWSASGEACLLFHFGGGEGPLELELPEGTWIKVVDSSAPRFSDSDPAVSAGVAEPLPDLIPGGERIALELGRAWMALFSRQEMS